MTLKKNVKNLFWNIPVFSGSQKESIYYLLKGLIKGKQSRSNNKELMQKYIDDLLSIQDLNNDFSRNCPVKPQIKIKKEDPKLIAYYLPQYYPDPHNTKWWGRGSTEWTNITKSFPQYIGQYQPRLPGELGHYDLRIKENIYRQIELASFFGIYGFCFYYYWFDGERLLDLPFNNFVNDNTITFPFSICWVNESWTKQWSGASNETLIKQSSSEESYKDFIKSCTNLFIRDNYIKIHNKPILTIYKPLSIPNPKAVITYWRDYVKKNTGLDLYLIASVEDYYYDYRSLGFDACSEFAPGPHMKIMKEITATKNFVCKSFTGKVYDYRDFVETKGYFKLKRKDIYRAISPMWDNTPRRKNKSIVLDGATPELYKQWLIDIIKETKQNKMLDDNIIFINAWNEWAEGAYLEPDLKWKYGYLEATKDAIIESRKG